MSENSLNTHFETNFIVMPSQCNFLYPMIFGGALFSELDKAAACAVNRLLHHSECDSAVTFKFEGTFHAAAEAGDIVFIKAAILETRRNAIVVEVKAEFERRAKPGRTKAADAKFVFVSRKDGKYHPHGISLHEPKTPQPC